MFGLIGFEYIYWFSLEFATLIFFFIFLLVRLWLGWIPKISFPWCLEVPQKFVWVGGWWVVVESEFSDRFGYSLRLALAKPNKITKKQLTIIDKYHSLKRGIFCSGKLGKSSCFLVTFWVSFEISRCSKRLFTYGARMWFYLCVCQSVVI